ncbi:MAG: exo-alpha-sialidase [Alistipes sp.]|nr:exo-alpha-sialidase [Alistipes sp.]
MKHLTRNILATALCLLAVCTASAQQRIDIFPTRTTADIPYRIPAIAALPDGRLICVADYRYSRQDIGIKKGGRIDLHLRTSEDNGLSWGKPFSLVEGKGSESPDFMNVGYGDPCIVADRGGKRVLVMSCAGDVPYIRGQRDLHQCIARFYSEDGGRSWSAPTDIAEQIYPLFDNGKYGPARSMFIASGRVLQSRYVKAGRYYRLYCAVLQTVASGEWMNFVLYSDDFGESWDVLGGVDNAPILKGADEAKVEELPDGNLLISSRTNNEGRNFNIFTFSNLKRAEGCWGEMAHSNKHNGGVHSDRNACNGELMVLPVVRRSDGREMYLLLQSLPLGPYRKNVGIYYKGLESSADIASPARIAENWEGVFKTSSQTSAYSTMAWQSNNTLGFLLEERELYTNDGGGYTIVYDNYTIEQITDNKYSFNPKAGKKPWKPSKK